MHTLMPPLPIAAFPWLNLVWVLLGIAAFMFLVAGFGRWAAATHPDPEPAPARADVVTPAAALPPEVAAAIAAAVYATLGRSARITSVTSEHVNLSVDRLMQQWSLEGRREIYSSHRVR